MLEVIGWQSRYGGPDLQTLANNKWQDARTMMSSNSTRRRGSIGRRKSPQ